MLGRVVKNNLFILLVQEFFTCLHRFQDPFLSLFSQLLINVAKVRNETHQALGLMCVQLVCDKMIGRISRVDFYHLFNEVDKILFGACITTYPLDFTRCNINRCNQGLCAIALIFKLPGAWLSRTDR